MRSSCIKKQLKNRSGVTLIEVLVGLAIAAIFATAAIALLSPINNNYARTTEKAQAQLLANNLVEEIRGRTNLCNTLASAEEGKALEYDGKLIKLSDDGYLMINGELAYPAAYYDGKYITLSTEDTETPNQVEISMTVKDSEGEELFALDTVLQPILLEGSSSGADYKEYNFRASNDPTEQLEALFANMKNGFDALYLQYPEMIGSRENPIDASTNYNVETGGTMSNVVFFRWIQEQGYGNNLYQFAVGQTDGAADDLKVVFREDDSGKPTSELYSAYYKIGSVTYLMYSNGNKYSLPEKTYNISGKPYLYDEEKLIDYGTSYYTRL